MKFFCVLAMAGIWLFQIHGAMAADLNQSSWSEVDGSNNATPPNGWPAGMQPNQVEPTARAMMGATKRFYNHINATATTAGTANAQTLTYAVAPAAYTTGDIYHFFVGASLTNTGATTLNVNGIGTIPVVSGSGAALTGGELVAGTVVEAVFDGANFRIVSTANTLHGAVLVAGGSLTVSGGGILLDNNQFVRAKDSGGTYRNALGVDGSNNLQLGDTGLTGSVNIKNNGLTTTIDTAGNLTTPGSITSGSNVIAGAGGNHLANNGQGLFVKTAGGTYVPQAVLDASNNLVLGSTLDSGQVQFWNGGAESGFFDASHQLNLNSNETLNRHVLYLAGIGDTNHAIFNRQSDDGEWFNFFNYLALQQMGGTPAVRLYISSGGLVGINTTGPTQSLDVNGNINTSGNFLKNGSQIACGNLSNAASSCSIDTTNAGNILVGTLASGRLSGTYSGITGTGALTVPNVTVTGAGGQVGLDNGKSYLIKDNLSNYRTAASIDASNNINLGDTNLTGNVTLSSNAHITTIDTSGNLTLQGTGIAMTATANRLVSYNPSDSSLQLLNNFPAGASVLEARDDGSIKVQVSTGLGGGACTYSGGANWSCASDANRKIATPLQASGIVPGSRAGDKMTPAIDSLKPISFQWKDPKSGGPVGPMHLGFNAQDVEAAFPQLVTTDASGMKSLDYVGLIAPLVTAVQELSARVSALEAKVP